MTVFSGTARLVLPQEAQQPIAGGGAILAFQHQWRRRSTVTGLWLGDTLTAPPYDLSIAIFDRASNEQLSLNGEGVAAARFLPIRSLCGGVTGGRQRWYAWQRDVNVGDLWLVELRNDAAIVQLPVLAFQVESPRPS